MDVTARAGQVPLWDKITIAAEINGKRVHLIYDTGSQQTFLFRKSADSIGLRLLPMNSVSAPPPAGTVRGRLTEMCTVAFGTTGRSITRQFVVLDLPPYLREIDGVISWMDADTAYGTGRVTLVDIGRGFVDAIPLPRDLSAWTKWRLVQGTPFLEFESPAFTVAAPAVRIGIDTGDNGGMLLSTPRWEKWRADRAALPARIEASWYPADGIVFNEILRARSISLGALTLDDVPVRQVEPSGEIGYGKPDAILGSFALRRIKVIIDRKNGALYTRPVANLSDEYPYNRLGAVFIPADPAKNDGPYLAHVGKGSPADLAGIRDGDILLAVDGTSVAAWHSDPALRHSWTDADGTEYKLLIKRGDATRTITVTLRQPGPVD